MRCCLYRLNLRTTIPIGGYIIEQLDRFPEPGESITTPDHVRLVVDKIEKNRIEAVHIYLPEIQEQPEEEE